MTYRFEELASLHYEPRLAKLGFTRQRPGLLERVFHPGVITFSSSLATIKLYRDPLNVLSYVSPVGARQQLPLDGLLSYLNGRVHIRRGDGAFHKASVAAGVKGAVRTSFIEASALEQLGDNLVRFLSTATPEEWRCVAEYSANARL